MASLKKELISGVLYMSLAKYAGIIVSWVVVGVLARSLPAEDFGIVAIATVIISFFSIFSDMGIAPAIVQYKDLSKSDLDNIFSFTFWSAVILTVMFYAFASPLAKYYAEPRLVIITKLLSLNLFFVTLNIVPNALLFRAKRFAFVAYRSLGVQLIGGVISVVGVLNGWGIYALLVNPIFSAVAMFIISYVCYPLKLRLNVKFSSLRKIFSFSAYQLAFNVVNYFTRNLDKLLIGRFIDIKQLGFYEKSYRLMMLPLQQLTYVISPVMHPIFSDYQNDYSKLSSSYLKVVKFLALIGFPMSVLLFFGAREVVLLVFGMQWEGAVPAFRILSLSIGIQLILSTSGSIFQAANATKIMFYSGIVSAILTVTGVLIGVYVFNTITAVAWFVLATFALNFILAYILMYYCTFKLPIKDFFLILYIPIVLTVVISAVLFAVSWFIGELPYKPVLLLGSISLKGFITLGLLAGYIQYTGYIDWWSKIKNIFFKILPHGK